MALVGPFVCDCRRRDLFASPSTGYGRALDPIPRGFDERSVHPQLWYARIAGLSLRSVALVELGRSLRELGHPNDVRGGLFASHTVLDWHCIKYWVHRRPHRVSK